MPTGLLHAQADLLGRRRARQSLREQLAVVSEQAVNADVAVRRAEARVAALEAVQPSEDSGELVRRLEAVGFVFVNGAPRPWQLRAAAAFAGGRDALVVWPAGGGKTLVATMAALHRRGATVSISPLTSLASEQVSRLVSKWPQTLLSGEIIGGGVLLGGAGGEAGRDLDARRRDALWGRQPLPSESREAELLRQLQACGVGGGGWGGHGGLGCVALSPLLPAVARRRRSRRTPRTTQL